MSIVEIRHALRSHADHRKAQILRRFFKTGPGEYAEGDIFIGVVVPVIRRVARSYRDLSLQDSFLFLKSRVHEERLLALVILVNQFVRGDERTRQRIYDLYLRQTRHINNWDLVDVSAPHIVGGQLVVKPDQSVLERLAASAWLWDRRISIVATLFFIRQGQFAMTFVVSRMLMDDPHDLIHKAVGWMLREVGKRDERSLEGFLAQYHRRMPRTMLRYAIERFPQKKRLAYLKGLV